MGALADQLNSDLKDAMRAKDALRLETIRSLKTAAMKFATDLPERRDLTEDEMQKCFAGEAKKRREAIEAWEKAGRTVEAGKEKKELAIIETYLPKGLSEAEVAAIVDAAIAETGATTKKQMGAVMKAVMAKVGTRAPGNVVKDAVNAKLA
jgi:uncharacterized protein YqeY